MRTLLGTVNHIYHCSSYRLTPIRVLIMLPPKGKKNWGLPYFSGGYPLFFKVNYARCYGKKPIVEMTMLL